MTSEALRLQEQLDAVEMFMKSPAYLGYLAGRDADIEVVKYRILSTLPNSQDNIAQILMSHGEWDNLLAAKKTFEDVRVTLKARIDEEIERETKNATDTKQ